jgi:translation initiation factor eIF-2B subunit delta
MRMVMHFPIFLFFLISEPIKRDLTEAKHEGAPTSVPQKPKLSKAERRAIQEAQRAAKAAAKEAGN